MDAFEVHLQDFNSTIYGSEMRESLYRCFDLLRVEINDYTRKIQAVNAKLKEIEGGD